jgi:hypothetical protein
MGRVESGKLEGGCERTDGEKGHFSAEIGQSCMALAVFGRQINQVCR